MKNKQSLYLLFLLQVIAIFMLIYSLYTYASIGFDAADNYWPFSRYFLTMINYEIRFMVLSFTGLLLSIFIKNITSQSNGRLLMVFTNYLIKIVIGLALLSALSGMHTILSTNNFNAFLPTPFLIIISSLLLTMLVFVVIVREVYTKLKNKN